MQQDSRNFTSPIFGYGLSAMTSADRFSYGSAPINQPPTVAISASASSSLVRGTSTVLSVLGGDDSGEAALTYTWTALAMPEGALPTFGMNGSNAAKRTAVVFNRAGSYTFRVTITAPSGQSVTSGVQVTVDPSFTSIVVSPSSAVLSGGSKQRFLATALDQFGVALAHPPSSRWSIVRGPGRITSKGIYTAPPRRHANVVVQARSGNALGRATVLIRPRRLAPLK
jgi:hypothetical protein